MKDVDLLSLITSELSDADQNLDFETPLDYYLGNADNREVKGRSCVVSTDVADAIEWIMPQIMKSFTQNNEIVIFDPVHPEDELQAEIESQYVYEVLMKENEGFIILHQFVKDALMQNNGFIKVTYESDDEITTSTYTGLTPEQLQAAVMHPRAEILSQSVEMIIDEQTQQPMPSISAKISITTPNGKICIESVAPEDFRVNSDHNSISLEKARFTAHLMDKTISDLREEGVSEKILSKLNAGDEDDSNSDYRFSAQGEQTISDDESPEDESLKIIHIAECYMHADADGDGIAEFMKITVAGHSSPYLIIDQEEIEHSPWVSTTAILMSHKWRGLSIYDRLKQIQDQKTALWRNSLDNIYFQNNQRFKVVEGQVNMSDMKVSRPGGTIRVKRQDAIDPLITPSVSQDTFTMMNYLDQVRAGRVGVAPEGEVTPQKIGERVGSQGVERLMSAKEELVGLIVRVIAETGVKPICVKIRNLCTKHVDAINDFQFRGQWVKVNPATWADRSKCTVRVGTGTGNHERQVMALREVKDLQLAIKQEPGQILVNSSSLYKTIDDFCKFSGLNGADKYFVDPDSPEGQQAAQQAQQAQQQQQQQQLEMQQMQLKFQMQLAQAETEKAHAAMRNVELKGQVESAKASLQHLKQDTDLKISIMQNRASESEDLLNNSIDQQKVDLEHKKLYATSALKMTEIEAKDKQEQNKNYESNKATVKKDAA